MKNLTIMICFIISGFCLSQNKKQLDSLLKLSANANDTTKLNCYNALSVLYQANDNKKVKYYALKLIELATKIKSEKFIASGILKIGIYHYYENNLDSAKYYFTLSADLAKTSGNLKTEGDAHQNLAIIYSDQTNYRAAINELIVAQKIQEQLKNNRSLANIKNNIALIYLKQKNDIQAESYLIQSIALIDTTTDKGVLGYQFSNLGIIYENKNLFEKSSAFYRKALKEFQLSFNYNGISNCYNNLYLSYLNRKLIDSAIYFNTELMKNSKKINDKRNEFICNINFSTIYQRYKPNPVLTQLYLDSARQLLSIVNTPEYVNSYFQERATYLFAYGNKDSAFYYMDKFLNIKDSITSIENSLVTNELQTKYETDKKELQLKQANSELNFQEEKNHQKTIIIWLGATAFICTLFFLIIAIVNYKNAKKFNFIVQNQNEVLELQKSEVENQKHIIEEKQNEIISSINYAQRIQSAVLTGEDVWNKISKEHFIVFQPRDIVSGDFYWAHVLPNGRAIFVLADCTGHGVPGGFMSMLGNSFLNELVVENKLFKADEILNRLREKVIAALFQKGQTEQKDGMDMALCVWNKMDNTIEFAGANNSIYIVRQKELMVFKGDKMPIGSHVDNTKKFTSQKISLCQNDMVYLNTDGYVDQFGGEKGKKFKAKQLEDLLVTISDKSLDEQKKIISETFFAWKNDHEQTDDVSLIGIKIT